MKTKGRLLSLILAFFMLASILTVLPPLEVKAAADVTCTFDPDETFVFGDRFRFSGQITSTSKITKVTVAFFDIKDGEDPDRAIHYFSKEVSTTSFALKDIPSFYVGDCLDDYRSGYNSIDTSDFAGIKIVIYVAGEGISGGYTYFEFFVNFESEIDISTDYMEFDMEGKAIDGEDTFDIEVSGSWEISKSDSWISVSSSRGTGDATVSVSCSKNSSFEGREGEIYIEQTSTGEVYTIDVYQEGKKATPRCTFSPDDFYHLGEAFDFSGTITCDTTISKVTVGIYDKNAPDNTDHAIHYFSQNVNAKSFSLSNIPAFTIGGYLDDYRSDSDGIDTSGYEGIIIVIYVAGDGITNGYVEFEYVIDFESSNLECDFSPKDSYSMGEIFDFSGTITCDTTISKVTVGIYDKNAPDNTDHAIHYFSQNVNAKSFSLSNIPAFTIGGYLDDYRSDSDGIDTSGYEGIIIVIYVAGDGITNGYVEFEYVIDFESSNLECDFSPKDSYSMGEIFDFSGTITCDTTISKVTVGIYDKNAPDNTDHAIHYFSQNVNAKSFSLSNIPAFTIGGYLDDYRSDSDGIDTSGYEGIIIVIYVAGENIVGGYLEFEYVVTFVRNANTLGDINSDGQITNKDRFWLNRFLAGMDVPAGFDQFLADINGDGEITKADAEYLSRHLAGWVGYEQLPEINKLPDDPSNICLHTSYKDAYQKTVWVNNTIKTNKNHSFYDIYNRVCENCGENIGKVQSGIQTMIHSFNSDGVCDCGAIDGISNYAKWDGINATGKRIYVYDTPYSTDTSYGQLFVGEEVTVLGSRAGRYLVQYTVTSTGAIKQGYVNTNTIKSNANYRIEFEFETITLPVSGKNVLLIPRNGSAYYHLYNGDRLIWEDSALGNLTIEFEDDSACEYGLTTITGNSGGFGTLSVYYVESGQKIYLACPEYYIVADSDEVYSSGNINIFSEAEKDYISLSLDMYLSQDLINVPYELYWSSGENFALCIEELDDILAALLKDGSATENDYAAVLAQFIEQYVNAEEANKTVDELDASLGETIVSILEGLKLVAVDGSDISSDLLKMIESVNNIYCAKDILPSELKELFVNLIGILNHHEFKDVVRAVPALQKAMDNAIIKGMSPTQLSSKIAQWTNNKFFKDGGIADTIGTVGDVISIGSHMVSFAVTTFGNYQRHSEILSMMLVAVESIPVEKRSENYDTLKKAIELLIDRYDQEFLNKLESNMQVLAADTIVWGTKLLVAYACPGATAVISAAQFFVQFGNAREEANLIRMRQFYLIMNQALLYEFGDLYEIGDTFSSIYFTADDIVKMYLNMALYTNKMADKVNEYTAADKAIYQKNIESIKNKFAVYLK